MTTKRLLARASRSKPLNSTVLHIEATLREAIAKGYVELKYSRSYTSLFGSGAAPIIELTMTIRYNDLSEQQALEVNRLLEGISADFINVEIEVTNEKKEPDDDHS
ncbi:MAG: hypothetical protein AAGG47_20195 [Pseudomonadota bacterium]